LVLAEMVVPEVNKVMLVDLEAMGFTTARATRALHFSGMFTVSYDQPHVSYM
jgi:UBX domain-containing protein 1/4